MSDRPGLKTAYAYAKAYLPDAEPHVIDMLALAYMEGAQAMNSYLLEQFKKKESNGN